MAEQTDVRPVGARTRQRRRMRRQTRRSVLLTALALIPGAGLLRTRYRRLGWVLLGVLVVAVVAGVVFVVAQGALSAALTLAVRPDALLTVAGSAVVVALVWIYSIVLTHIGTRPDRPDGRTSWGLRLFTAAVCLVVAVPALTVVRYSLIQRDLVSTIFTGPAVSRAPLATPTATPQAQARDPWAGVARVNVLLLGSDAGDGRIGVRTDSMVEASIDPVTGNTVLISIPRALEGAPFPPKNPLHTLYPAGYDCPDAAPGDECLINGVWQLAEENKALFKNDPNPGLTTIRDVVGEVTGLPVDYATVIDLAGFESLVNAMGGVTVNVTDRLPIYVYKGGVAQISEYIEPGRQKLDGFHALWYARSRLGSDDFTRMRRQRCLIGAMLDQTNPVTMLSQYPQLAGAVKDNVYTDISVAQLPAWVTLVQRMQKGTITSLTFTLESIKPANPDYPKIRATIRDAVAASTAAAPSGTATGPAATAAAPGGTTAPGPSGAPSSPQPPPPASSGTPTEGGLVDVRTAC